MRRFIVEVGDRRDPPPGHHPRSSASSRSPSRSRSDRTSGPIVALRGAGLVGFLIWAAILVLVNRFARPVLVALTGRLLFSTMGLFVVVINAIAI